MTIQLNIADKNFPLTLAIAAQDPEMVLTTQFSVRKKDGKIKTFTLSVLDLLVRFFTLGKKGVATTNARQSVKVALKIIRASRPIFQNAANCNHMYVLLKRTIDKERISFVEKQRLMKKLRFVRDRAVKNVTNRLEGLKEAKPETEAEKIAIQQEIKGMLQVVQKEDFDPQLALIMGKFGSEAAIKQLFATIGSTNEFYSILKNAIRGSLLAKNKETLKAIQANASYGDLFFFHFFYGLYEAVVKFKDIDVQDDFFDFALNLCKPTVLLKTRGEIYEGSILCVWYAFLQKGCAINDEEIFLMEKLLAKFPPLANIPLLREVDRESSLLYPLFLAVGYNSPKLVDLFLKKGANPDFLIVAELLPVDCLNSLFPDGDWPKGILGVVKLINLALAKPTLYPIAKKLIEADKTKQTWVDAKLITEEERAGTSVERVLEKFEAKFPLA
ncbi:hypothetical protein [Parachlamydia sp. AcF125]|uniref:hypothetical protein n=1 Tax=Parachlamydia sp. AcF125 TaxID=2795736 RepID=UPI001BCA40D8|nr:hypothetical protein [Parachlamydia sp. AcF125]MBS4168556.1 hypothetical protein [Parachlamydia sp. AcF125]